MKVMSATNGMMNVKSLAGMPIAQTRATNRTLVAIDARGQIFRFKEAFLLRKKKALEAIPRPAQTAINTGKTWSVLLLGTVAPLTPNV
jgi:hypothetical protein